MQGGGAVNLTEVQAFWEALANPLLVLSLAITVAMLLILTIIDGFSLGAGFLASVMISAVVAALVLATSSLGVKTSGLPQPPLPVNTVHTINYDVNASLGTPSTAVTHCSGCVAAISPANEWATAWGWFLMTWDTGLASVALVEDSEYVVAAFGLSAAEDNPVIFDTLLTAEGMFLTFAAFFLDAFDEAYSEPLVETWALTVSLLSDIVDGAGLAVSLACNLKMWTQLDVALFGLDMGVTGYSAYQYRAENN